MSRWRSASSGIRCRGNTWFLPYEIIDRDEDRPHPRHSSPAVRLLPSLYGLGRIREAADPFLGLQHGRRVCPTRRGFVGIEMDAGYLAEAVARTRRSRVPARARDRVSGDFLGSGGGRSGDSSATRR